MEELNEQASPAEIYKHYLQSGELVFQHCESCGAAVFYPRVACPVCGRDSLESRISSGRGTVYATTAVYHREGEPHNVALVDLEEGFRMMSRVENVPAEEVEIGMDVSLEVRQENEDSVAVFVPEKK